ncbi:MULTISPECIES: aspartate--tRNA ligase [Bacillus]|uniref:Aspartate--tRNA ligase n=1 Tax=Bacillus glycinifermentans TaxID=1664069 RepID=A0AAJ3Z0C7_9BACI|nr:MULTISPECIES: aspartate--tRNA ligase [Bacillus]KKB72617.1 aspartate--tRNA ligase [Bacillus sp. TH008]MDU0069922.1 aspartate--tRNA ligase [Bacillus sp. IG6]MED8017595.1 aspartate--tRNA ligase [Bacillus glycinifermentans]QAT66278.1 aspartate--tRNA ligase [Bacillus glycinifermentans]WKB75991.1 aspartate--tRNA ligase [Bacillus glycinifermentans]
MFGRTYYCGEITEKAIGETVVLKGWVQKRRDLGGLIFIDLRDRSGIVQVVFNPDLSADALKTAETIRSEYVLDITGKVVAREEATVNPNLKTGKIEIQAESVTVLSAAKTPPFAISDQASEVSEDVRLKHRYLDLRRPEMYNTLKMRHNVTKAVRSFLDDNGFIDIETPVLTRKTPEGARDYLVPSRVHEGEFYALPQSPQLFKQLLMVSGFDRYYQIARCFRDEDLRADRQPEFTQIDIEMSFMSQEDIMKLAEEMIARVLLETRGIEIPLPLPRMSYQDAMNLYGSDKPDTRFGMLLTDVSETVKDSDFKVFASAVADGGAVKAINVKGAASKYSRKDIDALGEFAANYGAKGLAWLKAEADGLKGPIAKFFQDEKGQALAEALNAAEGDLILFVADRLEVANDALGALRLKLGKDLKLIDESLFNFLWVVDWPLLEYDSEEGRFYAAHHPFTMPVREDLELVDTNPEDMKAQAYDLVLNGYELGGGSIRIFEKDVQEKMFALLGLSEEEAKEQFGFLLEAFEYGAPPHGGIALGLDRLVMLLSGRTNLRDTIAFPKTASASCLLMEAPSEVDSAQLDELHLSINRKVRQ